MLPNVPLLRRFFRWQLAAGAVRWTAGVLLAAGYQLLAERARVPHDGFYVGVQAVQLSEAAGDIARTAAVAWLLGLGLAWVEAVARQLLLAALLKGRPARPACWQG